MTRSDRSSGGCFVPILAALAILALLICWHNNFFGMLDKYREGNPILEFVLGDGRPSGVPSDAIFIRQYGGINPESASQEEMEAGMEKGKSDLDQAIRNMEPEFYLDSKEMLMDFEQIPIDAFWVDTWSMEEWKNGLGQIFYRVEMKYNCTPEKRDSMQAEIDQAVAEYQEVIASATDQWDTELLIHDKLIADITYDDSKQRTHRGTIYGALVEHQAVCEGYARAYVYLLDTYGVSGAYIATTWEADKEGDPGHAWNCVPSTSESNLVDVTWDDPDEYDANGNPYILHDYFLIRSDEAERLDEHQHTYPETQLSNPQPSNYHEIQGWYLDSPNLDELASIYANQLNRNKNMLTVKFANQDAFEQTAAALLGPNWQDPSSWDGLGLSNVLANAGGSDLGTMNVSFNQELYIINIYLNPQA